MDTIEQPTNRKKALRILIVEDHPVSRNLVNDILNNPKYSCDAANNGTNALKLSKENRYDVILMDLKLPDIDGIEVVKQIRKTDSSSFIIAVTAYPKSETEKKCYEAGFNDFVTKPFNIDELLTKIDNHL